MFLLASRFRVFASGVLALAAREALESFEYGGVDQRIGSSGELVVLYRRPLAGAPLDLLLGAGVFDDTRRGKANDPDNITQYDAQGIVLTGGVAYRMITPLSLEARVEVRGGEGRFSGEQTFANGNYEVLGNYGRYIAVSAVVAAYYELPRAVSVGVEVGFDDFEGKSEYINDTLSLRGDGLLVRLGLGYRF